MDRQMARSSMDDLPTDTDGNPVLSIGIALELLDINLPEEIQELPDGDGTETRGQQPRTMRLN